MVGSLDHPASGLTSLSCDDAAKKQESEVPFLFPYLYIYAAKSKKSRGLLLVQQGSLHLAHDQVTGDMLYGAFFFARSCQ
jgi:hypothetical protein